MNLVIANFKWNFKTDYFSLAAILKFISDENMKIYTFAYCENSHKMQKFCYNSIRKIHYRY